MKDDKASTDAIRLGSIVQISPKDDHGCSMFLGVVTNKESHGVQIRLHGGALTSRTWNLIEPTGGMEIFRPDGARWNPDAPSSKHHP